jgi:hypothetical protein
MPEAWEITTSDNRIENKILTFIIFCEDQNDEPYYFRSFEVENKIKINCIPNQKKAKLNLINTLVYCKNAGLVDFVDHAYKIKEGITENIWCVYDRDLEQTDFSKIKDSDDINFTTSIQTATQAGLKVAWSNDAFELWILLHFEIVPNNYKIHRDYIYGRLTEILKTSPAINKEYSALIIANAFNYKMHLKKRFAFLKFVLPILKEKIAEATKNAKILESAFDHSVPYHECNPCTKIHHLTTDLIAAKS